MPFYMRWTHNINGKKGPPEILEVGGGQNSESFLFRRVIIPKLFNLKGRYFELRGTRFFFLFFVTDVWLEILTTNG